LELFEETRTAASKERLRDIASCEATVAFPDEPLRVVVYRMAESGFTRLPVVDRADAKRLQGMVSLDDLLRARGRDLEQERTRERVLRLRLPLRRRAEAEKVSS
jgi:CBS domain-containing protein